MCGKYTYIYYSHVFHRMNITLPTVYIILISFLFILPVFIGMVLLYLFLHGISLSEWKLWHSCKNDVISSSSKGNTGLCMALVLKVEGFQFGTMKKIKLDRNLCLNDSINCVALLKTIIREEDIATHPQWWLKLSYLTHYIHMGKPGRSIVTTTQIALGFPRSEAQ